ncbi:hypothetical protein [Arenibacter amylolyticus]|uniref:hypothetical protein n=1 Tax=Arenibacter amylolyticus TaxID=1406873 RepID=UPI00159393C5|nr:hypothetical protein [Arenibacter amylolyticus]
MAVDIFQPAIGMEKEDSHKNTWLGYSGKWIAPDELTTFTGSNRNIAINVELSN